MRAMIGASSNAINYYSPSEETYKYLPPGRKPVPATGQLLPPTGPNLEARRQAYAKSPLDLHKVLCPTSAFVYLGLTGPKR